MSYQLPDLLTFLTSALHSSDDGDLQINPAYDPKPSTKSPTLRVLLDRTITTTKINKLQKTPKEVIQEYNPALLASLYLPFTSILKVGCENEDAMTVVWEWLCICMLVVEETINPGRIVGIEDSESIRGCLEEIAARLSETAYTSNEQTIHDYITEILHASNNPPPKSLSSINNKDHIIQYLNWRIKLSGHRVLSKLFLAPNHQRQYSHALDLALQIIVCVTVESFFSLFVSNHNSPSPKDLIAYNLHQAWHATATTTTNSTRNHLNLISFILHSGGGGGGDSEVMTLQAAINILGEMIRQRMVQLQAELYQTKDTEERENSGGILSNIFSSFFSTKDSPSPAPAETPNNDRVDDKTAEIRKTIWNWVTGIIHWAYEVEYFSPDLEDDVNEGGGKKKKKRGGEIRDYGWVFLISNEMS